MHSTFACRHKLIVLEYTKVQRDCYEAATTVLEVTRGDVSPCSNSGPAARRDLVQVSVIPFRLPECRDVGRGPAELANCLEFGNAQRTAFIARL